MHEITERLARAALPHVPFDGWSDVTFRAACSDAGVAESLARVHCPRGAVDLALAAHQLGDDEMRVRLAAADLAGMRFRERVVHAIMLRLDAAGDREVVRRASALFALPQHAAEGARAIWQTSDAIWTALGDTSDDLNWYSKRAILSGIYGATVLYWLGDETPDASATRDFVERRIAGVMAFEETKARLRQNPLTKPLMTLQARMAACVKAPQTGPAA
ncbi:COQ9 family protein [Gemmobacter nectariphilus]|uniref:COQ9 family protein n=1 Tax=Gemmobacter nectariphilus TaxID=220343 RepID=UPI000481B3DF|nr:COQ9 family protein [Gemmobacter nectariphilus]